MDNPEKLEAYGTEDEEHKKNQQHNMYWTNKHK
jgi:hypothetical protein